MESRSVGSLHCAWCLCSLELGRADRPGAAAKIGLPRSKRTLAGSGSRSTFFCSRPTPGLTYFPLLGGMCDHVMPSWSSIARSRLVRVAVHPDAHLRCLGSRSRMAGRPPTLWAAGPHRQSADHFQCLGQGTAPSHLAQNVQAHEGRSLRGAHEAPLVEGTDYSN